MAMGRLQPRSFPDQQRYMESLGRDCGRVRMVFRESWRRASGLPMTPEEPPDCPYTRNLASESPVTRMDSSGPAEWVQAAKEGALSATCMGATGGSNRSMPAGSTGSGWGWVAEGSGRVMARHQGADHASRKKMKVFMVSPE